ncbi:MAG: LacI family DNA-binding transcriptional regulator [Solirubrobacteraceae bacterium]
MPSTRATRRVTLRDVAEASGVSQSTVSFVLNEVPNQTISAATRERVRTAARELGYVPNGIAKALMEGTSRIVVLNVDRPREGHYSHHFIRGLDRELALFGFILLVRHGHAGPSDDKQIADAISPRAVLRFGESYLSGQELEDSGGGWKNGLAAHVLLQLRYLTEQGHTQIALALPENEQLGEIRVRFAGEVAGMLEIPRPHTLTIPAGREPAQATLAELRRNEPGVTAIAAFDDMTALRVLTAMSALRLSAPDDMAVIGFDETEHAAMSRPSLTTIRMDAEGHGRLAARRVLGMDTSDIRARLGRVIPRESA